MGCSYLNKAEEGDGRVTSQPPCTHALPPRDSGWLRLLLFGSTGPVCWSLAGGGGGLDSVIFSVHLLFPLCYCSATGLPSTCMVL